MNQLVIDDFIRSYNDLNLLIEKRDLIPITKENKTLHTLLSRDGQLIERHGTYKEKSFSITFHVSHSNLSEYARLITEIFLNAKTIHFTDDDTVFYKIINIECEGIKVEGLTWGKMDVKFTIMPFSYLRSGLKTKTYNNVSKIELFKEGTAVAKPVINIYTQGTVKLSINNEIITLNNIPFNSRPITINSELLESNYGFQNGTGYWKGNYPVFNQKINIIQVIEGTVSKIEITPNWAYL